MSHLQRISRFDETRRVRMAVIGCGAIGALHASAIRSSPKAELAAACDLDLAKARACAGSTGVPSFKSAEEMFETVAIDAAAIATPDDRHVGPALAALRRGLHVFCEKPLAASASEAALLVRAARDHRAALGVNYNRRFAFGYLKARELIDSGELGTLQHAVLHVCDGVPRAVSNKPHALLFSLLSHHVDLLRMLCGEIRSVHAEWQGPAIQRPFHAVLAFRFLKGGVASLTAGWRPGQTRTVEHFRWAGTKGVLVADDLQRSVAWWRGSPDEARVLQPDYFAGASGFYDTITAHLRAFIEAIADGRPAPVTGLDGWAGLRVLEAAIQSRRAGRPVQAGRARFPSARPSSHNRKKPR